MIERISLNSLKFFYFVAKFGSVTIAAEKLFVTQSAVSKQVQNVEQVLGVSLFDRRKKSFKLTAQGVELLQSCENVFVELDQCLIKINQKSFKSQQLILSCEPTISMKWLIPRLAQFKSLGHDFEVVLVTGGGRVCFEKNNIDLAIRRDDFDWGEDIYSEKLADEYVVWVRNPKLSKKNEILVAKSRPRFLSQINKNTVLKRYLKSYSIIELEHFYLCLEGCLAGLGDTIISIYMIEKELQYHLLKPKFAMMPDASAYYLLSSQPLQQDQRKMIFLDWLKMEMLSSQMKVLAQI